MKWRRSFNWVATFHQFLYELRPFQRCVYALDFSDHANVTVLQPMCWVLFVTWLQGSLWTTFYLSSHYCQSRRLVECLIPPWSELSTACLLAVPSIELNMFVQPKLKTKLSDAVNQKVRRRRSTLFKKASEYSAECGADIHLVLRMKKSGKIFILTSNSKDWPLSDSQLVSFSLLSISSLWTY